MFQGNTRIEAEKRLYDFQGLKEKYKSIVTVGNAVAVAHLADGEFVWNDL